MTYVCRLTPALCVVSLFVITTLMETLLGLGLIAAVNAIGRTDDEPEQWFDKDGNPCEPPTKYVWRVINGKRTKVIDFR